jgi:hypothetical protein
MLPLDKGKTKATIYVLLGSVPFFCAVCAFISSTGLRVLEGQEPVFPDDWQRVEHTIGS